MKRLIKALLAPFRRHPGLFRSIRLVCRPGPGVYRHLYFFGDFDVNVTKTASFRFRHFGLEGENELFWNVYGSGYEATSLRLWAELSQRAQFIADVGANTGIYALAAGAINPAAQIVALEPVPRIFDKLIANLSLNNFKITPMKFAASDTDGEAVMFDTATEHSYSASLNANMLPDTETFQTTVPTVRLDTLFDQIAFPRVDLLKIDVEKHEPNVLRGMKNRLLRDKPTLLIEILNDELGRAVSELLQGLDYFFFAIHEGEGLEPCAEMGKSDGRNWNYLVCQPNVWKGLEGEFAIPKS